MNKATITITLELGKEPDKDVHDEIKRLAMTLVDHMANKYPEYPSVKWKHKQYPNTISTCDMKVHIGKDGTDEGSIMWPYSISKFLNPYI